MDIFKKLPDEIKWYILSFHANPQPKYLLNDIKHYTSSRNIIQNIYIRRWDWSPVESPDEWLDNDLVGYLNNNVATMSGYVNRIYDVFSRHFMAQKYTKTQLISIFNSYPKNIKRTNNLLWGILTMEERDGFIEVEC
jgi:hypothetical protein